MSDSTPAPPEALASLLPPESFDALLGGIVQLASEGIISIDAGQTILLFNRGAEEIFGYTADEVLGQSLNLLIPERYHADHAAQHLPGFARAHATSRRMGERREVFGRRRNGDEFPAEVSISKGDVSGQRVYNAVVRDVTERKRYEAELRARSEELSRSNRELEQFAYVASHDLQEPLRMVASYTQLLARRYEGKLDAQADKYIHFAVDGAQRMQSLINDLLALSRVGTLGKPLQPTDLDVVLARVLQWLQPALAESHGEVTRDRLPTVLGKPLQPTDLDVVLARVLQWLQPALAESHGEVTTDRLPTVLGDAGQLEQLFQNLVANALKFRRADAPPRVHVSAARQHGPDGAEWVVGVRDNGIGFDMQFAEQIFVVFQRLHTRAEYPGTGVGLAICKKIVERHGGRIWVESSPGEGTAFHLTFPDRPAR